MLFFDIHIDNQHIHITQYPPPTAIVSSWGCRVIPSSFDTSTTTVSFGNTGSAAGGGGGGAAERSGPHELSVETGQVSALIGSVIVFSDVKITINPDIQADCCWVSPLFVFVYIY